nr:14776_t:CDS:2 [Entrophospora candida]
MSSRTSTPENIAKVYDLISDDPHMRITAIEENIGISRGSIQIKNQIKHRENWLQIARTGQNAKKRMFCDFFSIEGIVARIVVPKVRNVMMHHDNAAPHKSKIVTEHLKEEKIISLSHPPYSPDLASYGIAKEAIKNHLKIGKIGYKNA